MKSPVLLAALSTALVLAAPVSALAASSAPPLQATVMHGDTLQGDCKKGRSGPGHHRENDGRPKHGDAGCR